MKKWSRKKRWVVGLSASFGLLLLTATVGYLVLAFLNPFHAHEHCAKGLGLGIREYGLDHFGQYPYHTNGFGDALLLLVKEGMAPDVRTITAPGDDGKMYMECLRRGLDVPEDKCSRIYIQGLSEANALNGVVMAFDAYPTRGGDHFRRPWGKPSRDVVMSDGSMDSVFETQWPAYAKEQIDRLVKLGFKRDQLEKLFGIRPQIVLEK